MSPILSTLKDLIRIRSTHDRPEELMACADYIANFFHGTGLTMERFVSNGIPSVIVTKNTKTPKIFLSGHFDVVSGTDEQFEPIEKDGRVYGRGALDMKSGDAVMMHLIRDLAGTKHDVGLMLTGDEELGGFNGTQKILENGYGCEVAIIPDGGEAVHRVISKEKGIIQLRLVARGIRAHGSMSWHGDNAIDRLVDALVAVRKVFTPVSDHPPDHWMTTCNIGTIVGGESINQVPDHAEVFLDVRFTQDDSPEQIEARIKSCLPQQVDLMIERVGAMVNVSLEHELVRPFSQALKSHGRQAEFVLDHGSSDGRFFAEHGIPVIISQPDGANLHAPGEWVDTQAIVLYYKVLKSYVDTVA